MNLLVAGEGYSRQEGPSINAVSPTGPSGENDWFNNHYVGIDEPLEYSGGLLLANVVMGLVLAGMLTRLKRSLDRRRDVSRAG